MPAPFRETGGSHGVVDDRERQADREALGDVAVDRDRGVAPALHHRGDRARAAVASLAGERRAQVPDDLRAVAVRDHRGGEERRVVQVDDREAVRAHQPLELPQVRRQRRDLAAEHEPAQALVGRVPRVGEDRDLALVHGRARVREEVRGGAFRAEDVRLEAVVEVADQLRERRRRTAELRAVVDVEHRDALALRRDPPVDRLDPARVLRRVEVLLRVGARGAPVALAARGLVEELRDRLGERLDAEVVDEDPGLARDDDAASRARARSDDRNAGRGRLDHRTSELGALGRSDHDVGGLVEVRRVLREGHEAEELGQPELVDELLRLGLVVPRQVGELERAADERAEELLAADGAADDQVARVEPAVAQPRGGLDELAEALRGVDEAEVRDDRPVGGEPERRLRSRRVAGVEAVEVDRVRDDRRADAEDVRDVVRDRDRRRRELPDRRAHERRASVLAAVGERRAQVPDDRQVLLTREPRRGDQRRVVEVDELELVPPERAPEAQHVLREERELAREEQPAASAVRRRPDVREAGDRAGVHPRAGLPEELGRGTGRAVDVRLELLVVELADQVRERRRRTAELGAVVDEQDRRAEALGHEETGLAPVKPMLAAACHGQSSTSASPTRSAAPAAPHTASTRRSAGTA